METGWKIIIRKYFQSFSAQKKTANRIINQSFFGNKMINTANFKFYAANFCASFMVN